LSAADDDVVLTVFWPMTLSAAGLGVANWAVVKGSRPFRGWFGALWRVQQVAGWVALASLRRL